MEDFVRFNVYRKPEYRLITIRKGDYFMKKVLKNEAKDFLMSFVEKYKRIRDLGLSLQPVKPEIKKDGVYFKKIDGHTLTYILEEYVKDQDYNKVISEIKKFKKSLLEISYDNPEKNYECKILLGNEFLKEKKWLKIGLIDLIFDNILVQNNKKYLIDYEWVWDFPVPTQFVFFRSIYLFFYRMKLKNYNIGPLINEFKDIFKEKYIRADYEFLKSVSLTIGPYSGYKKNILSILDVDNLDQGRFLTWSNILVDLKKNISDLESQLNMKISHIQQLEQEVSMLRDELELQKFMNENLKYENIKFNQTLQRRSVKLTIKLIDNIRSIFYKFRTENFRRFLRYLSIAVSSLRFNDSSIILKLALKKVGKVNDGQYLYFLRDLRPYDYSSLKSRPKVNFLIIDLTNDKRGLKRTLKSIRRMRYDKMDITIISDNNHYKNHKVYPLRLLSKTINKYKDDNGYVVFLESGVTLTHDFLKTVLKRVSKENADIIYSDEDINKKDAWFKPNFSKYLLYSINYFSHCFIVNTKLLSKKDNLNIKYIEEPFYELILSFVDDAQKILHIDKVLFHNFRKNIHQMKEVNVKILQNYLRKKNIQFYTIELNGGQCMNVVYKLPKKSPLVSIIIPFKDKVKDLKRVLKSIEEHTEYKNYEIILISNNSEEPKTFSYLDDLKKHNRIKILEYNIPFNYSQINNYAAAQARGEYIVLMNNDIELLSEGWLKRLLGDISQDDIGVVGCKLYFEDRTIQHGGIIIGGGRWQNYNYGIAGHAYYKLDPNSLKNDYLKRLDAKGEYSAVTAALLITSKKLFDKLGGFDERFASNFNDVDYCLRVLKNGYKVLYNPGVSAVHYESKSRKEIEDIRRAKRLHDEVELMLKKYGDYFLNDPFYNKNLALTQNIGCFFEPR